LPFPVCDNGDFPRACRDISRHPFPAVMKLIGSFTSPFVRKVRIVLAEKKIDCTFEEAIPNAPGSRVPDYNPLGKIPVLALEDGRRLFDSRVIVEFLDNVSPVNRLIPAGNRERSDVKRWEALADGVTDAALLARLENQRPESQRSADWIARQSSKVEAGLAAMDRDLGDRSWCSGIDLTLADIAVGCCLGWLDFRNPDLKVRERFANLGRLMGKLNERPAFAETAHRA
jgi:glutathione S-transferase